MKNFKLFLLLVVITSASVLSLELYKDKFTGIFVNTEPVDSNIATVLGASDVKPVVLDKESPDLKVEIINLVKSDKLTIKIKITNTSNITINFAPGIQLYLIDKNGVENPMISIDSSDPLNGGPLSAGESYSGSVNFNNSEYLYLKVYEDPIRISSYTISL